MILCHVDSAHGEVVRSTLLCQGCYEDALDRVKREMRRRREPASVRQRRPAAQPQDTSGEDRKLAAVIARSVVAADAPVTRLHERLSIPKGDALARAVEIAKREGWIRLDNGRGFVPGPRAPMRKSPEEVAKIVWASIKPVRAEEIAGTLGVSTRTVQRLIGPATRAGWIENVRGKGYRRGPEKPPEISERR